jgi:hypothetical protein
MQMNSRQLMAREVHRTGFRAHFRQCRAVVANTNVSQPFSGEVIIDSALNGDNDKIDLLFSNNARPQPPGRASTKACGSVEIHEVNGAITNGPARVVSVSLRPLEVQLLRKVS